jgi:hypothetical protein
VTILAEGVNGREDALAEAVRDRLAFTCRIREAPLPRTEGKAKRLYRVYAGEEPPR